MVCVLSDSHTAELSYEDLYDLINRNKRVPSETMTVHIQRTVNQTDVSVEVLQMEIAGFMLLKSYGLPVTFDLSSEQIEEQYPDVFSKFLPMCQKLNMSLNTEDYVETSYFMRSTALNSYKYTLQDLLNCLAGYYSKSFSAVQYLDKIFIYPSENPLLEIVDCNGSFWGLCSKESRTTAVQFGVMPHTYMLSTFHFVCPPFTAHLNLNLRDMYINQASLLNGMITLGGYLLKSSREGLYLSPWEEDLN